MEYNIKFELIITGKGCQHAACHHKCKETPMGHKCECLNGYILGGDARSCIDINECEQLYSCSQYCHNIVGSFTCSCSQPNYQLRSDKVRCKAVGMYFCVLFLSHYTKITFFNLLLINP